MLTPAILGSLRVPLQGPTGTAPALSIPPGQVLEATLEATLPGGLVLRLPDGRTLQAAGSLPFPPGPLLTLKALPLPQGAGLRLQVLQAAPPPTPALLAPLLSGEAAALLARLQVGGTLAPLAALFQALTQPGLADQPEAWSKWLKEAMTTLADPAASPAEATFHRLQAKEGTAWFEVPLPWAPGADPLRIWIESDREAEATTKDAVHRVFLSVPFSTLGEVRAGFELRRSGLRVRLWLDDPERLAPLRSALETELGALGRPVDIQLLPLPPGTPDLRALAGAPPLQALG